MGGRQSARKRAQCERVSGGWCAKGAVGASSVPLEHACSARWLHPRIPVSRPLPLQAQAHPSQPPAQPLHARLLKAVNDCGVRLVLVHAKLLRDDGAQLL